MSNQLFTCPFCGRNNFRSQRGVAQHQNANPKCDRGRHKCFGPDHFPTKISDNFSTQQLIPTRGRSEQVVIAQCCQTTSNDEDTSDTENGDDFAMNVDDADEMSDNYSTNGDEPTNPISNRKMLDDFKIHSEWAASKLCPFTHDEKNAIALLDRLRKSKASLNLYESVTEWHFRSVGASSAPWRKCGAMRSIIILTFGGLVRSKFCLNRSKLSLVNRIQ